MTHADPSALLRAALDAAERGWHVFPLLPGGKRPAVRDWEHRATTDPARIRRCWAAGPFNIGLATGPSGLVVVDLDTRKSPDDTPPARWDEPGIVDGADVLATLAEQHDAPYPATTRTVRTGRGGAHLYFTAPAGEALRNTAGTLGWKVDTRAGGGYVVAAGSTVPAGRYTTLHDAPPEPLPGWLLTLLRPAPLPPQRPITVALAGRGHGPWLRAAVNGELARVTGAQPGDRNNSLYRAAVALGQIAAGGGLDPVDVTEWLLSAALQVGQGEHEARATIASGLRAGAHRPRQVGA